MSAGYILYPLDWDKFRRLVERPSGAEEWRASHSMHPPEEVERMQRELTSVRPTREASKIEDALRQYEEDLMPALKSVIDQKRMLFVSVDT